MTEDGEPVDDQATEEERGKTVTLEGQDALDWFRGDSVDRNAVEADTEAAPRWFYFVPVWPCHVTAIEIFKRCQPQLIAGYGFVLWQAALASEIKTICEMKNVPVELWDQVLDDVQDLTEFAAEYRNSKTTRDGTRRRR